MVSKLYKRPIKAQCLRSRSHTPEQSEVGCLGSEEGGERRVGLDRARWPGCLWGQCSDPCWQRHFTDTTTDPGVWRDREHRSVENPLSSWCPSSPKHLGPHMVSHGDRQLPDGLNTQSLLLRYSLTKLLWLSSPTWPEFPPKHFLFSCPWNSLNFPSSSGLFLLPLSSLREIRPSPMNFIMLYTNDSCCNVDLLIFNRGFLSVCWVSTRARCLSHSAEQNAFSLYGDCEVLLPPVYGNSSRSISQHTNAEWERSACLRLLHPKFFFFFFFPSYMFIYGLKTQSFSSGGNFSWTTLVLPPLCFLLFYSRTCAIQLWNLVSSPQILLLLPIFCPAAYTLKISSTYYISIGVFISAIIHVYFSSLEYSKYNIFYNYFFLKILLD